MTTGCNEGSIMEVELAEDDEIVGMFGALDDNLHLKSFGIIVHSVDSE